MQQSPAYLPTSENYKALAQPVGNLKSTIPLHFNYKGKDPKNITNQLPLQPILLKTNKTDNPFTNHHFKYR
jgi:hypothetical protein